MSEDELFVLIACVGLAAYFGLRALVPLASVSGLHSPASARWALLGAWGLGMAIVHGTLITISSYDVQDSTLYTAFYDVMGLAWIAVSVAALHRLDLSLRDDAIERRNPAAVAAIAGAIVGFAMAYAGGNVGDGPGWWCVVIASGVGTLALFGVWIALSVGAAVNESITVERDLPAGIRVGALLAACGMIFGRGAAGDWISARDTVISFAAVAWPAVIVVALAIFVERALAPRARVAAGGLALAIVPAVIYLGAAAALLEWQGLPS